MCELEQRGNMFYKLKKLLTIGLLCIGILLGIEAISGMRDIAETMDTREDLGRIAAQYEQVQVNFGVLARAVQGQAYHIEYLEKQNEVLTNTTAGNRPAGYDIRYNDAWREPFESWAGQFDDDAVEMALGSGGLALDDPQNDAE